MDPSDQPNSKRGRREKTRRKAECSPSTQSSSQQGGVPARGGRITGVAEEMQRNLNSYLREKGAHLGVRLTDGDQLADSVGAVAAWL